jgi:acyl carrier protein
MQLAALWSEVLAIEKERIGINDGFFKLGGHSLKANILVSKIHKTFYAEISMMEIFMYPKLKDLAEFIRKADRATYCSIQPTEEKEYYPLSSAQKRLYILQQMDPRRINYNVPAIAIMKGFPDKAVVENTFKQLIKRHESLRTSFFPLAEEVAQVINKEVTFAIEYYDFPGDRGENNSRVDARADKIVNCTAL